MNKWGWTVFFVLFLFGCANNHLVKIFGEEANHNFLKSRWGMTQAQIEFAHVGDTLVDRTTTYLIYKTKFEDVPCKLIYTFKNNRLRTAGYITHIPVKNAENIIKKCVSEHGMPTVVSDGMTWKTPDTVIYARSYRSVTTVTPTKHAYSSGGALAHILHGKLPKDQAGVQHRFDAMFTFIDKEFYSDLEEMDDPLRELIFYEKQLFGIILRRGRTIYKGGGFTLPSN